MGNMHNGMGRPANFPYSLLTQAIHRLTRCELEDLAQSLIDHIDGTDGDFDLEEDDPAGQCDEDGVNTMQDRVLAYAGPGCVISDEDFGERDADRMVWA